MGYRDTYYRIIQEDRDSFGSARIVYENELIVVKAAYEKLPAMATPWKTRPKGTDSIKGVCLHHSAVWSSFGQQQRNESRKRAGGYTRLSYTLGIHHDPTEERGKIVVYQFNEWDAVSHHSGGKAEGRSPHYKRLRVLDPHDSVNAHVVGLNLRGLLITPWHHLNWPERRVRSSQTLKTRQEGDLILPPSQEQIRGAWGVHLMLKELFPSYLRAGVTGERSWFLGHFDTGKAACPGTHGRDFVESIRAGTIQGRDDVEAFLQRHGLPAGGYPTDNYNFGPSEPGVAIKVLPTAPTPAQMQWLLVCLGWDLGTWGKNKDGVDGRWGQQSADALEDFEDKMGILVNGDPDTVSFTHLNDMYKHCYGADPDFTGSALAKSKLRRKAPDFGVQDVP